MISLAALKPDQAAQYFKKDNYYSKDVQKENSRWSGKAAALMGLSGHVEATSFHHLCHGKSPDGSPLEGGEYVYVISGKDLQGKKHVYQGVIVILK